VFHESLIDVLFELALNAPRLDMVFSTTSTLEPITTYYNAPPAAQTGSSAAATNATGPLGSPITSPRSVHSSGSGGGGAQHFDSYYYKREPRVQVLNKQLVHLWVLPLILHLLPYAPLGASLLTLENFTWLLSGQSSMNALTGEKSINPNLQAILWHMSTGQGNLGAHFFLLVHLAAGFMEQQALANAQAAAAAAAAGGDMPATQVARAR